MIKKIKNFLKKLNSNHGSSMMEVMVAVGVLSTLSLATMEIVKQLNKNQMASMRRADALDYIQQIRMILIDSTACTNSFNTVNTSSLPSADQTIRDNANAAKFSVATTAASFGNKMKIESLKVTSYNATTGIATVRIIFMYYNGDIVADPTLVVAGRVPGNISVTVELSGTTINKCYSEKNDTINESRQFVCSDAGGIWNNTSKDCTDFNEVRGKACSDGGGTWSGSDCSNYAEITSDARTKTCSDIGGTWYASSQTCSDFTNITKDARSKACSDAGGTWTASANANYGDCTNYAEAASDARSRSCSDAGGSWVSGVCAGYRTVRGEACGDAGGSWVCNASTCTCDYWKVRMLSCQSMIGKTWNNADRKCY